MAQHFFPLPVIADIQDIEGFTYPEELKTIPKVITQQEIEKALQKLPNDKAPGPDGIPNVIYKRCADLLLPFLGPLFRATFQLQYYPNEWKTYTTIVLRKPGRPDYTIPKAYRGIALLNNISKILTSCIAEDLSY